MAKYKIVVNNSKQAQANPQTQQIMQQMAQNAANQQLQQQAQAQAEATDPMRQTVNDLLKNKLMNNIEVPQYTTIQDVLNANKGDRLSTFADFLSNPQTMRTIGNFLPSYGYNPKTGKVANPLEPMAQQEEALMQQRQAQALQQLKEQNDIATALNNAYKQMDIANERNKLQRELAEQELDWKRQENALDRELRRQENAENRAMRMTLAQMSHGGGGMGYGKPLSDTQIKEIDAIQGNITNLMDIENRYKDKKYKDAFGMRGQTRATLAEKHPIVYAPFDNEINLVRQDLDMLRQRYGKAIEGGRMSDADRAFYRNVLMAQNLSYDNFLEGVRRLKANEQKNLERKLNNYTLQGKNTYGYAEGYLDNSQPTASKTSTSKESAKPMQVGGYTIEVE